MSELAPEPVVRIVRYFPPPHIRVIRATGPRAAVIAVGGPRGPQGPAGVPEEGMYASSEAVAAGDADTLAAARAYSDQQAEDAMTRTTAEAQAYADAKVAEVTPASIGAETPAGAQAKAAAAQAAAEAAAADLADDARAAAEAAAAAAAAAAYVPLAQRAAPAGVATLDGAGKVPSDQIPALAITDVYDAADEAAMLALVAESGDVASRLDGAGSFMLRRGGDPSVLADWLPLRSPTDVVTSVDGRTGGVNLADRYDALGASTAAVAGHAGAGDPHAGYLTTARGDARYDPLGTASQAVAVHAGGAAHAGLATDDEVAAAVSAHNAASAAHAGLARTADLAAYALRSLAPALLMRSGAYYGPTGTSTNAPVAQQTRYGLLVVPAATTFDRIGIEVVVGGSLNSSLRFVIRSLDPVTTLPGVLVATIGTIDGTSGGGFASLPLAAGFALAAGIYAVGVLEQNGVVQAPTIRCVGGFQPGIGSLTGFEAAAAGYQSNSLVAGGNVPQTDPGPFDVTVAPRVLLRKA